MTGENESCTAGPTSMSYLTCLTYILEEWTGVEDIGDYLSYAFYILWVLFPLVVVFVLPGVIVILFYVSILWLHIYKRKNEIKEAYSHDVWIAAREMLATIWDGHGRIWHGYELHGVENIPQGPGLVVFYHGATPVDYIYFTARLHIMKKRRCSVVADHFVFRVPVYPMQKWCCHSPYFLGVSFLLISTVFITVLSVSELTDRKDLETGSFLPPGFRILLDVFGVIHGPKEACVRTLEEGHLLAIAPGGLREALFSDETYNILWSDRKGFAQVAIDAKVPIIPMFTQNVREGFRTLGGIKILRSLYERIRLPIVPLYGGFPVKLRTFIGEPIPYEPNMTAEELATKTKAAVQALIDKHQKIPGNIFRALMERFQTQKKED